MKKRLLAMALATMMVLGLTACGGNNNRQPNNNDNNNNNQQQQQPDNNNTGIPDGLVLKVGHTVNTDHGYHQGLLKFKEVVEEKTGGKVTVEIYPSSQMGSEREMIEGIQMGTVDMCLTATATLTGFEPKMQLFDLPFLFKNREHAFSVLDGDIGKDMLALLESQGIKGLAYYEVGFRNFTNSKNPINVPDDIKGKKFRLMETPVHVKTIEAWGGNPITMAVGELYTALQQKTVDGQENPLSIIQTFRFFEVQKYLSITEHFYTPSPLLIQKKMWDSYSPEFQAILQEAADAGRDVCRQTNMAADEKLLDEFKNLGMEINHADKAAFQEASKPIYDMFAGEIGQDKIDAVIKAGEKF